MELGAGELVVILLVVLLLFGPSKLPKLGEGIGSALANFRKAMHGDDAGKKPGGDDPGAKAAGGDGRGADPARLEGSAGAGPPQPPADGEGPARRA